jgi:hypothetical protein
MEGGVRRIGIMAAMAAACWPLVARAQEQAPAAVVNSAVAAVQKLGDQVVLGRHEYAIERMYPRWKERTAKRLGGMEALEKQLAGVVEQMRRQGIAMLSFKPSGVPKVYEVWPGRKVVKVDGADQEVLIKTKWMVLIPTVTKFRIIDDVGKYRYIERKGFQVAIADKGTDDWTFMDGSGISVADLRSLFPDVPANLELPPLGGGEVDGKGP